MTILNTQIFNFVNVDRDILLLTEWHRFNILKACVIFTACLFFFLLNSAALSIFGTQGLSEGVE